MRCKGEKRPGLPRCLDPPRVRALRIMAFALWIDRDLAWAQGLHEYRLCGWMYNRCWLGWQSGNPGLEAWQNQAIVISLNSVCA